MRWLPMRWPVLAGLSALQRSDGGCGAQAPCRGSIARNRTHLPGLAETFVTWCWGSGRADGVVERRRGGRAQTGWSSADGVVERRRGGRSSPSFGKERDPYSATRAVVLLGHGENDQGVFFEGCLSGLAVHAVLNFQLLDRARGRIAEGAVVVCRTERDER